jgi:hypothetical protein
LDSQQTKKKIKKKKQRNQEIIYHLSFVRLDLQFFSPVQFSTLSRSSRRFFQFVIWFLSLEDLESNGRGYFSDIQQAPLSKLQMASVQAGAPSKFGWDPKIQTVDPNVIRIV